MRWNYENWTDDGQMIFSVMRTQDGEGGYVQTVESLCGARVEVDRENETVKVGPVRDIREEPDHVRVQIGEDGDKDYTLKNWGDFDSVVDDVEIFMDTTEGWERTD